MPISSRWKIQEIIREVIAVVMEPEKKKKREGAPEGKLKGKGSDRKVASLTLVLRAQTWLWGRERRCKTGGKNVNNNKEQGLCPGEMLTPHPGKGGNGTSCHRTGDTKSGEIVAKEPQRWQ